jgi:predicted ArsR family transcriptional regulator
MYEKMHMRNAPETNDKELLILHYLERRGGATTANVAEALGCSANTARKWLYRMQKSGLVYSKAHYYGRGIYLLIWFIQDIPF